MIRLVFCDLRDHAATWAGAFAIAVACGYLGGWVASLTATFSIYPRLQGLTLTMLPFSLIAAVAVLVPAANLTVSAQRRSYALWQLAGVSPRRVGVVVLTQLAVVAVLGAACGTLVEAATFAPLFPGVFSSPFYQPIDRVVLDAGLPLMPVVWLVVAGVFLLGGLRGARSAAATPPLAALRDPEPKHRGMTWLRMLLFAGLATGACGLAWYLLSSEPEAAMDSSLFLPLLAVAVLVPVAPLVFSALLGAWTSVVPQARWNAWYLARRMARNGLASSTSVEAPIMVGVGLLVGIFSLSNVLGVYAQQRGMVGWSTSLDWTSTLLLLGGPVLLCAVGAAVGVVMTSRSRTRDVALLIASGARPATLVASAACEAFIHAITATLAGVGAAVASNAVVAVAVGGMPLFGGLAFGEGLVVALVGFALVLVATLVPTWAALNREAATVLAVQE
ncbi:MAG: ABC transporter permease [Gordonibacter sp.]